MEIESFIENFSDQFDDTDINSIQANTVFKDIDEWSSLTALSVVAMCDEEYNVSLRGEDINSASSVEDLFNIVISRM